MTAEHEAIQRSNPFIELPTRIFLTGEGLQLFSRNPAQVQKELNRDGIRKEGLISKRYNAVLVQKLVLNSYAEEIFVSEPALLKYRAEIISTNNLIVYAILYKKLSPSLAKMFFESSVVKAYNRKNPRNSIVNLDMISTEKVDLLRTEQKGLFETMEREIHDEVSSLILNNTLLSEEDKKNRIRSLDKFIAWIDRRIWYLYLIIYKTMFRREMMHSFSSMIAAYLSRTQIATHLSNLLMEFIQNAEKAHMERIIVKGRFAPASTIDSFLRDSSNRSFVEERAMRQKQMLELSWDINSETIFVEQKSKIALTVSNYGLITEAMRQQLSSKMRSNVAGISLAGFYDDTAEERLGAGLGLLYNSFLEDICRKEGIHYKCNIFPEPQKEKTSVKLEIIL